jgi:drug/metabolite transporter (DMT)-like permease
MPLQTDYIKLHFIVFLWGFSAILGALVSIPAVEMVFARSLFAIAGMACVVFLSRGSFRVSTTEFIYLIGIGFIVAIHWISFFGSARIANVSVSLIGFATNSLWAALLEPLFNKTRIKKFELLLGCCVITGLIIIFSFNFDYQFGLALGVIAGFTSALFSIFNSRLVKRISSLTITFYEMVGAALGIALFLPFYKYYWAENQSLQLIPQGWDWLWIILLSLVCSVYAYTVAVELMKRLSVFVIQLSLNLEPIYGMIMAIVIFGDKEKMGINFYIGTAIILVAVLTYPFFKNKIEQYRALKN